ncbi:MAG: hypothetical protein IPF75_11385 [Bacteroidetes bacterium]|nr:hypothetical protein [Bacteroidota bacterium]
MITYYSFNSGVLTYLSSTGIEYNSTGKVLKVIVQVQMVIITISNTT